MALISPSPSMPQRKGSSATQDTSVGGGSRPTPSKMKIPVSAPVDARTLDRTGGMDGKWLGQGEKNVGPEA
jgi:hypothetical protein